MWTVVPFANVNNAVTKFARNMGGSYPALMAS